MKSRDGKSWRREEKRRDEKRRDERRGEERRRRRGEERRGEEERRRRRRRRRRREEENQKRESLRRKEIQVREKVGKSRNTAFFPMICGSGGSKSRLAKAAGAEPAGLNERWTIGRPRGAKHISKSICTKHTTFGRSDVEKVHARVARSTFPSQNAQNTSCLDHFWKLWCRKSARGCGAKHISKSKCTKHTRSRFGPLLGVEMMKKCMRLWREAHFQVKMHKAHHVRSTFGSCDVEKVHAIVARSTFPTQKWTKHTTFGPLLEVVMSKKRTPL